MSLSSIWVGIFVVRGTDFSVIRNCMQKFVMGNGSNNAGTVGS